MHPLDVCKVLEMTYCVSLDKMISGLNELMESSITPFP